MVLYGEWQTKHAEAYQILSQFFLSPPDDETLKIIRQDFGLDSEDTADLIEEDFLFLFSSPDGILQPVESIFTHRMGAPYEDVTRIYAGAGIAIDNDYDALPDHLAVELLFMSYLCENGKTELEKQFLEEHLMNWAPDFCEEVRKQAKTMFYREIAEIVKDFLVAEYDEYDE